MRQGGDETCVRGECGSNGGLLELCARLCATTATATAAAVMRTNLHCER